MVLYEPWPNPLLWVCLCSKLWGCQGELADTAGKLGAQRLLDWSYAGYMAGEMPIPRLPVVASIMDFGAVGDGVADDTSVSEACVAAAPVESIASCDSEWRAACHAACNKRPLGQSIRHSSRAAGNLQPNSA
jgi:hypothetical protein